MIQTALAHQRSSQCRAANFMHGQASIARQVPGGVKLTPHRGNSIVQRQIACKRDKYAIPAFHEGSARLQHQLWSVDAGEVLKQAVATLCLAKRGRKAYLQAWLLLKPQQRTMLLVPLNGNDQGSMESAWPEIFSTASPRTCLDQCMLQTYSVPVGCF